MIFSNVAFAADVVDEPVYDEIERTVSDLNIVRRKVETPPLEISRLLKEMASTHSKYMSYNSRLTSVEESNLEYFRGRYPWDRASYHEYGQDFVYEFVRKGMSNYQVGINSIMADPVSRAVLFDPMYTEIGMANSNGYFTFDLGGDELKTSQFVSYPYKNQENVPIQWKGTSLELVLTGEYAGKSAYGYPITIGYYGSDIVTASDVSVSLRNVYTDTSVAFDLIMPGEHYLLKNTMTILPKSPYEYNAMYELEITYRVKDARGVVKLYPDEKYHFKTEGYGEKAPESNYITRGRFTELLVKSEGYSLIEPLEFRFSDVDIKTPQSVYIYTANNEALIQGFPDGSFGPDLNITRDQAYTVIVKAFEKNHAPLIVTDNTILSKYKDHEQVKAWAKVFLQKAAELGILLDKDASIRPNGYMTESEIKEILALYKKNTKAIK